MRDMKAKYYVFCCVCAGLIAHIAFSGCGGTLSPSATVKAFYEALNKGNINEAKGYLVPDFDPTNVHSSIYPLASYSGDASPSRVEEMRGDGLKLLADSIQEIEIEGEHTDEVFGETIAEVVVRVTLKPGVNEKAQRQLSELEKKLDNVMSARRMGARRTGVFEEYLDQRWIIWFITDLPERQKFSFSKWNGKWKIAGWARV